MEYKEVLTYLEAIRDYGIAPGLDTVRELCRRLGNPQNKLRYVHIAGTNGKGSVLAFISTILKCAGYRVGRYFSPALTDFREGIQIGERKIPKYEVCEGMEQIKAACGQMTAEGFAHPTLFEVNTALAFLYFRKMQCDIVVLETGMGGKEDATNIIENTLMAVITPVSMDHTQFLGKSLPEIAWQKAGIIKNGCMVVSAKQSPEVKTVIERTAKVGKGILITTEQEPLRRIRSGLDKQCFDYKGYKNLEISLGGSFQIDNAVVAVEAIEALRPKGYRITETALKKGLLLTKWPGRFMAIGKNPLFIADGAHNEEAVRRLAESVEMYFTNKRIIYIMGILRDKDYEKMIAPIYRYADQIITVTPPDNPRAMSAYELAVAVSRFHPRVTAAGSLEEAVEMSYLLADKQDVILAFGSLSYLGRLLSITEKKSKMAERKGSR